MSLTDDILMHYGMPRRSGRYPWGSGDNPYQHSGDFLSRVEELKKSNFTFTDKDGKTYTGEVAIAKSMGLSTTQFRTQMSLAKDERRSADVATAKALRAKGYSLNEIADKMGFANDSSVRSLLNESSEARMNQAKQTAEFLKKQISEKGMIDVGTGVERELGISKEKMNQALYILEMEGYCGKCRTPKEAYFPADKVALFGRDRHPAECDCQRAQRMEREAAEQQRKHRDKVEELKRLGFTDPAMREWTFANDNGRNPQMKTARFYVEHWEDMKAGNIGYLLWGSVGTGKSYLAGCIANALMEQEISVKMTNFAAVLNDLAATFEGRNEYISKLCRYPLLILDDFGMERGTEYGLEQVYNVIDSRYRSEKPLIVTTNLSLDELNNPPDTAHKRIYDRVTEMCTPVCCSGVNFRREKAQEKMERLKKLMND